MILCGWDTSVHSSAWELIRPGHHLMFDGWPRKWLLDQTFKDRRSIPLSSIFHKGDEIFLYNK